MLTQFIVRHFIKEYKNTENRQVREKYGKVAGVVGILTNLLLFAAKFITGYFFHSIAIMADAVNNLSDSGSSIITLVGFKLSSKPADEEHPYGHARIEYISGLIISFIIATLGLQLAQTSVQKIMHPDKTEFSGIMIIVLAGSIVIKLWQSVFYRKMGKAISSATLAANAADSRNDVISTTAVLAGTILTYFIGFNLDGIMGLVVAAFILITGVRLVITTSSPLLGKAPSRQLVDSIYAKILSYDGIMGLHDLTVHSYGEGRCFASVHCEVPAERDIMVSHDIIDNIERDFLRDMGIHLVIHLDPVVRDDERTLKIKKEVHKILREISSELSMHDFRVVYGTTHSNLIFDVVVPYHFYKSDKELSMLIAKKINELDPKFFAVITIDHEYIPPEAVE